MTSSGERSLADVRLPVGVSAAARTSLVPSGVIGLLCIVAGGMLAAVTAPAPSEGTSWAAAYLVLVGGVAQIAFGVGQATFNTTATPRAVAAQLVAWNAGNGCVLAGTLAGRTAVVDVGGVLLLVALLLLVPGLRTPAASLSRGGRCLLWLYRAVVVLLVVSIPIGLVLARLRS